MRLGASLCNFGGDSKSDSSVSTINDTKNWATSIDKRAVAQDSAVSLTGDGNTVNRNSTTNFADSSNRSTTNLTSFIDNSFKDSSTKFTDNSDRSVHNTVTDYGSVGSALNGMGAMTTRAFDSSDLATKGAIDVLKLQTTEGHKTVADAFALARASSASSQANSAAVLGFASNMVEKTSAAFAEAEDGGQSKMVMGALAVVAIVGVAFALKN